MQTKVCFYASSSKLGIKSKVVILSKMLERKLDPIFSRSTLDVGYAIASQKTRKVVYSNM